MFFKNFNFDKLIDLIKQNECDELIEKIKLFLNKNKNKGITQEQLDIFLKDELIPFVSKKRN